jgi:hypothetical protein
VPVSRCFLLIALVVAAAAFPSLSGATDVGAVGTTTTVVCSFDPHSQAGVTACSQLTIRITGGDICYPAGVFGPNAVRLFFHDEFSSSRQYQGSAIPGQNSASASGSFGGVPLNSDIAAWDDAIYARIVRTHAHLISSSGVSESRLNSYAFYVDDPSCA